MSSTSGSYHDAQNNTLSFSNSSFLFDTGAEVTVLSQETASSVGFNLIGENPSTPDFYVQVAGVGGVVDNIPGFYMDSLTVPAIGGNLTFNHVPVIVYDLVDPSDGVGYVPGIIGMNLFTDRDLVINGSTTNPQVGISPLIRKWNSSTGGTWNDASKWANGVPNNVNTPVAFFDAISTPQTITVGSDVTVGGLSFDNSAGYTINGPGRITMQQTMLAPTLPGPVNLWVGTGSHTINAPMTLATNTIITVQHNGDMLTLSNDVTVNSGVGITKVGDGAVAMKNVRADSLAINAGSVSVIANGTSAATSVIKSLAITARQDGFAEQQADRQRPRRRWHGDARLVERQRVLGHHRAHCRRSQRRRVERQRHRDIAIRGFGPEFPHNARGRQRRSNRPGGKKFRRADRRRGRRAGHVYLRRRRKSRRKNRCRRLLQH